MILNGLGLLALAEANLLVLFGRLAGMIGMCRVRRRDHHVRTEKTCDKHIAKNNEKPQVFIVFVALRRVLESMSETPRALG